MRKFTRGKYEYRFDRSTGIVVCRWSDNSEVTIVSNFSPAFPLNRVRRFSQRDKIHIDIDQPDLISTISIRVGVDRGDQYRSFQVIITRNKWYFPLFTHCIDMAIHNAWQLHRLRRGDQQ